MWETIKNDPIFKTMAVIVFGVLAFGFAFNIMFGSGASGAEGGMMSSGSGYSLTNTLGVILAVLIKIVFIAALVGVLIWIVQKIKKSLSESGKTINTDWITKDPLVKNSIIVIGGILALGLIYALFRGSSYSVNTGNMMNNTSYNANGGSGISIQPILVFLTKLLILLSTLGLGYGIFMYIKETHLNNPTNVKKEEIEDNPSIICPNCKEELKASWKCCPSCGSDKAFTKTETVNSNEV